MNRIVILLKLAITIIPFYLIGYFLNMIFRHKPGWLNLIIFLILTVGAIYFIYKKRKGLTNELHEDDFPEYLKVSSYFLIVIGAILGHLLSSSSFRTVLYIDNGLSIPIEITIKDESTMTIPGNSYKSTSLPTGENEILIEGKTKKINLSSKGNWIFNIDSINTYILTSIDYSNGVELYKDGQIDSTKLSSPDFEILQGELINVDADYLFEAPETITVQKNGRATSVKRTVLYRINK
jgi:hypothetical protein